MGWHLLKHGFLWVVLLHHFHYPPIFGQGMDVAQPGITGSATALAAAPFGQTFQSTTSEPISGIAVALVNVDTPSDLFLALYASDPGGTLLGQPLASAFLDATSVGSFASQNPVTPSWVFLNFPEVIPQSPGQTLAFVIEPNPMLFYYSDGNPYPGGAMLRFPDRDLTFSTLVVPEPSTTALLLAGAMLVYFFRQGKRLGSSIAK